MTLTSDWLAKLIREENCAFLCGAGVSVPSGLPSAADYVQYLVDLLIRSLPPNIKLDKDQYQKLCGHRMEFIFQVATQTPGISVEEGLTALEASTPNLMHTAIMQFAAKCGTHPGVVLTTNFECLLEDAGLALGLSPFQLNSTKSGMPIVSNENVSVFKLHGSTQHGEWLEGQLLKATLDRFGKYFSEEEETVLDVALHGRTLIVLGYSGNDHFDVTPYLFRRPHERLVWIQHDSKVPKGVAEKKTDIPNSLLCFFKPGDIYLCCNTPEILSSTVTQLGVSVAALDTPPASEWKMRTREWVDSLGSRAVLFMADLLLREDEWELAIALYQHALSILTEADEFYLKAKAHRNIGAALTLSGDSSTAESYLLTTLLNMDGESSFSDGNHKVSADEIMKIAKRMETKDETLIKIAAELLMEIALTHNSKAGYSASYVNTAILFMTLALNLAAKCRDYPLLGKIHGNFGRIYHQMGVNRDMDQQSSIATATPYFMDAFELFKIENNFESIIGTALELGPCLIVIHEYNAALGVYQQGAWYARAFAYQNEAWNLRFLLGLSAATAGFLAFMRKDKGTTIEELLDTKRLESINALELVQKCANQALDFHKQGRGAHITNTIDLANFIHEQGYSFATNDMKDWGFS